MAQTKLDIAQTIYDRRVALGMTQKQLADAAGVGIWTIGSIENRRFTPRLDTLVLVLDALGLKMEIVEV